MKRLLLSLLFFWIANQALAAEPVPYKEIIQETISGHIRPRFDRVANATKELFDKTKLACAQNYSLSDPNLHEAFKRVLLAWEGAQHLRWGPARTDYRHERMSFGADPKDYVGRQLKRLISKADESELQFESFARKSVAIQGLTALERLLYRHGGQEGSADYRCKLVLAITRNMAKIADEMASEWRDSSGYSETLLTPGPDNPLFRTWQESAMTAFKPLAGGLRFMLNLKIKDPLQTSIERARPYYLPFWRSDLSAAVVVANLDGLQSIYLEGGFSKYIASRDKKLDRKVRSGFSQATAILKGLDMAMQLAVKDQKARAKLEEMATVLDELWTDIAFGVAGTLELSVGFNEFDGD